MTRWTLQLSLDPGAGTTPLFLQIARAISEDIRRGRLAPGQALPGSRALAESLGVHRNTVLGAYQELQAEGWIFTRPAGGTFVTQDLPERRPRRAARAPARGAMPARTAYELRGPAYAPPAPGDAPIVLGGGIPDVRLVPVQALARAYRRALLQKGPSVLGYADPRGHERLRAALASMLSSLRGICASADTVMVTRGSQMALHLLAQTLITPGDAVVVEALGYPPAWEALRRAGADLVPVPVDEGGLCVDALAEVLGRRQARALYITPHHQYPTMATLAPGRRLQLLDLARRHRLAIIEDDYDYEFHYEGRPILPLCSADTEGAVIYVGTLSKMLAPGLRVGFVAAPEPLILRLAQARLFVDRQGDHGQERALAELIEDGEVGRHARRMGRIYRARRDALLSAMDEELRGVLRARPAAGGMAIWAEVQDPRVDADEWARRGPAHGVVFAPARHFTFDGRSLPFLRLGYASLDEEALREAARRMRRALPPRSR
jgi:GntR family transcriptional regulator/MocR family aminotransferase